MARGTILVGVVLLVLASLVLLFPPFARAARSAYEDVALIVRPSAERAYEYGTRHFDATHPDEYDIDRAAAFFEKAHEYNPELPLLQHQRARIAFLKGDFNLALDHINNEITKNPESSPSSYYVRGLIKGFKGEYRSSAEDYERYLREDPTNWAAINDYAWVLLKDNRPLEALVALDWGLMSWPENPWLLNSKATAHYELGQLELAEDTIALAVVHVGSVTEDSWMRAYPGNDPLIAREGVTSLQEAVRENMHIITLARKETQEDMQ